jgi:hypothetical protein
MKTAVEAVFTGKERHYNRRFPADVQPLPGPTRRLHTRIGLGEGSGREPGRLVRERFFTPRLRVKSLDELNAWLLDKCVAYAKAHKSSRRDRQDDLGDVRGRARHLVPYVGPFDGFHSVPASVSKTCTVRFDNNKYSVLATAVGRPVEVHAYAERIVIRQDGVVVGEHARASGGARRSMIRGTMCLFWHANPARCATVRPFRDWVLPPAMAAIRRKLKGSDDGDRQMVPDPELRAR